MRFPIPDVRPYEVAFVFDGEGCADVPAVVHQLKASCSHPLEILVRPFYHRFLPVIAVRAYSYRRSYVTEWPTCGMPWTTSTPPSALWKRSLSPTR